MQVAVEDSIGPERGYYHDPDQGTWLGDEKMSEEEAEELGYSRCGCVGQEGSDR